MTDFASLAQSLKDNEAYQEAMTTIRTNALDTLATVKRDDEAAFYTAQATVKVVDDLRDNLEQMIRSGQPQKKPGLA